MILNDPGMPGPGPGDMMGKTELFIVRSLNGIHFILGRGGPGEYRGGPPGAGGDFMAGMRSMEMMGHMDRDMRGQADDRWGY